MKIKPTIMLALILSAISSFAFGQSETTAQAPTEVRKETRTIKKEVRMEEENGVNTLTISTDENGNKTQEIYVGDAADKKMAEMVPEISSKKQIEQRMDVRVDKDVNDKKVTITKSMNGEETVEVYEGEAADKKLKELESETGTSFDGEAKRIVIVKKEVSKEKELPKKKRKN